MTDPSQLRARRSVDPYFVVREVTPPRWQLNRFLYHCVGEQWGWADRLEWDDEQWQDHVASKHLRTFMAYLGAEVAGYYELSHDKHRAIEIVYFGLVPTCIGRGLGAALLTDALERAWAWDAQRVWVHTCTRDHPAALANYEARGMSIYDRQTEEVP